MSRPQPVGVAKLIVHCGIPSLTAVKVWWAKSIDNRIDALAYSRWFGKTVNVPDQRESGIK